MQIWHIYVVSQVPVQSHCFIFQGTADSSSHHYNSLAQLPAMKQNQLCLNIIRTILADWQLAWKGAVQKADCSFHWSCRKLTQNEENCFYELHKQANKLNKQINAHKSCLGWTEVVAPPNNVSFYFFIFFKCL